jgi:hypothetical protein
MARYTEEIRTELKRVLMCNYANGYRFEEEDIPGLVEKTGLSRDEIFRWERNTRSYHNTQERMNKFFEGNDSVSALGNR